MAALLKTDDRGDEGSFEEETTTEETTTEEITVEETPDSYLSQDELAEDSEHTLWLWTPPSKRRDTAIESLSRILEKPAGLIGAIIDSAPALMAQNVSRWQMQACVAITAACGGTMLVKHLQGE